MDQVSAPRTWDLVRLLFIGCSGACVTIVMPGIIGGLVRYSHFSENQAAMVASAETMGMAASTLLVAPFMARANRRILAGFALLTAIIANIVSAFGLAPLPMIVFRLCSGFGEGLLVGVVCAEIAGMKNPDSKFALLTTFNMCLSALFLIIVPRALGVFGDSGIFFVLLAILVIAAMCLKVVSNGTTIARLSEEASSPDRPKMNNFGPILLGLVGMMLFFTGVCIVWPMASIIGLKIGIDPLVISRTLAIAVLAGAAAGAFGTWLGTAIGRAVPLILGTAFLISAMGLLGLIATPSIYELAVVSIMIFWVILTPFYMGLVAELDPSGNAATVLVTVQMVGMSLGPMFAALLFSKQGFATAVLGGGGFVTVALCLVLLALTRVKVAPVAFPN